MNDPAPTSELRHVRQVFRDGSAKRWRYIRAALVVMAVSLCLVAASFLSTFQNIPHPFREHNAVALATPDLSGAFIAASESPASPVGLDEIPQAAQSLPDSPQLEQRWHRLWGCANSDDSEALRSLENHAGVLTDVVLTGLHLVDEQGNISRPLGEVVRQVGMHFPGHVWELLDDRSDVGSLRDEVTALGESEDAARRFAEHLASALSDDGASGVLLAFEDDDEGDPDGDARAQLVESVAEELHRRGFAVGLALEGDFRAETPQHTASFVDVVMVKAHQEGREDGHMVPVAPQPWMDDVIDGAVRVVPRDKLVIALATQSSAYTVLPLPGGAGLRPLQARMETFQELIAKARAASVLPRWDAGSGNLTLLLPGPDGIAPPGWTQSDVSDVDQPFLGVWMVDGATMAASVPILKKHGITQLALDDLGGEDERVWSATSGPLSRALRGSRLSQIPPARDWQLIGDGVELWVDDAQHAGTANIARDSRHQVVGETFQDLPATVTVVRRGSVPPGHVVLTFDDGPSAEYTPIVLDILRKHDVKATFFLVGSRAEREPELVRRIVAEGHEIGNHSFSHPDLGSIPARRAEFEIRATNLLLSALTDRSTILFRPPFRSDDSPSDPADIVALAHGQAQGMTNVVSTVDPRDWARPGTASIVQAVLDRVQQDGRGVVLLHDGGGDRTETVQALEPMIMGLRSSGYSFGQIHELFGDRGLDQTNPREATRLDGIVERLVWGAGTWTLRTLQVVAFAALLIGIVRFSSLIFGALAQYRLERQAAARNVERSGSTPFVSVVVPAYNEAKVIERTVRSVLASQGVDVQIVVVDDGSTDDTAAILQGLFSQEPRVIAITVPNGGKSSALNVGFARAAADLVVALDADTIFLPDTIAQLIRPFSDPKVAAVAGRAVVGNARGIIGRWQALEYVTAQAVERRAWLWLGVVSVVPGSVGAWRRGVVLEAGGFASDTLAEDCDLTIQLQKSGHLVRYAPSAVALTEAPESLRALWKQRYRWSFGVLQSVWKHREAMLHPPAGNPRVGQLLLPTVVSCHLVTPLFAPLADLAAAVAIYLGYGRAILLFVMALFLVELVLTLVALRLDRAPLRLAYDWLVNRMVYRWILFFPLARAVLSALRGGAVGWGKLARTGSVVAPPMEIIS